MERLLRGPALPSPAVQGAVLVDPGPANMDLVVGVVPPDATVSATSRSTTSTGWPTPTAT